MVMFYSCNTHFYDPSLNSSGVYILKVYEAAMLEWLIFKRHHPCVSSHKNQSVCSKLIN
jgi:hypothetical protein